MKMASAFCGAGGNRTRVQTRKQYAFYMFIPRLNFRIKAGSGPPTFTLSSEFYGSSEASLPLSPIYLHHLIGPLQGSSTRAMSRSSI